MTTNSQPKSIGEIAFQRNINVRYCCERVLDVLPALRTVSRESGLSRNDVLSLVAAKTLHRKDHRTFASKDISNFTGIPYNNINLILIDLFEKGFLRIEVRGRKADYSPTRYALTIAGLDIVTRLEDITGQSLLNRA